MNSIFSINQDTFIYAVRQSFDARYNLKTGFNSHLKYIPFLENTWEKPQDIDATIGSLRPMLKDILLHHWKAIPHYKRKDHINLENISWFAHSISCLYADISYLLQEILGHEFLEKTSETKDFWDAIDSEVDEVFKEYAVLFHSYTNWKHTPKVIQDVQVDWNVRPPCGLLYRTQFKELFAELADSKYNKRNSQKSNKYSNDKKRDHQKSLPSKGSSSTQPSYPDKNKKRYNQDTDSKPHKSSEEDLNSARQECLRAIKTMQKNTKIPEIPLSAQNSFIRREQHTLITEAGFHTDSRGEGANRHVCILRNPVE